MNNRIFVLVALCFLASKLALFAQDASQRMNVLFIAVDDLRPELGAYGDEIVQSPHIDRLAKEGVQFNNAYCQQAVCAPSRNSVLTGLRPDSLKIYDLGTNFRTTTPNAITIPQYFKTNGYQSESIGKIYHIWHGNHDDTLSWSTAPWNPWNAPKSITNKAIERNDSTNLHTSRPMFHGKPIAWNASEFPEEHEQDSKITQRAVDRIKALKDTSFFLGIGYLKPHLPFNAPKRFWDLYDPTSFKLPSTKAPQGAPTYAMSNDGELTCCYPGFDTITFPLNDDYTRNLIHGYYACISFIDEQIGVLRRALEQEGLAENTLIVLWSDHGFKLGDYGHWCKHTNYEKDIHVPLIIYNPKKPRSAHEEDEIVELIDLYPTICEETGLKIPSGLQGNSLSPLINNQDISDSTNSALSQWPKQGLMGYSLRNQNYHYIGWYKKGTFDLIDDELYDLSKDPNETINVVSEEPYQNSVVYLRELLERKREVY